MDLLLAIIIFLLELSLKLPIKIRYGINFLYRDRGWPSFYSLYIIFRLFALFCRYFLFLLKDFTMKVNQSLKIQHSRSEEKVGAVQNVWNFVLFILLKVCKTKKFAYIIDDLKKIKKRLKKIKHLINNCLVTLSYSILV